MGRGEPGKFLIPPELGGKGEFGSLLLLFLPIFSFWKKQHKICLLTFHCTKNVNIESSDNLNQNLHIFWGTIVRKNQDVFKAMYVFSNKFLMFNNKETLHYFYQIKIVKQEI